MIGTKNALKKGRFFVKGFYITIKNDLLEPKHVEAMGEAVWLYMWLLDKITSINENGVGKVLGNSVIAFSVIHSDLGISERTYNRWVARLRESGYINTVRQKYGIIITVLKAKKGFKREPPSAAKSGGSEKPRTAKSGKTAPPEMTDLGDKNGGSLIRKTNTTVDNNSIDNNNIIPDGPELGTTKLQQEVGILYYQVIRAYSLPVTNHKVIKAKIKQMAAEDDVGKVIDYLNFLLTTYPGLQFRYKPEIQTALDIYAKRIQIKNAIERAIKEKQTKSSARIR